MSFKIPSWILAIGWIFILAVPALEGQAQDASALHQKLLAELTQQEGAEIDPVNGDSFWKFGVRITSEGGATGITSTCPVPIDWPEQTVVEVEQNHTDNVNRISFKRLTPEVQQMVVKIKGLDAGEVAEATVTFRIRKTPLAVPENTADLRIPTRTPSKIRKYLSPSPYIESSNRKIRAVAAQIVFAEGANDWQKVEQIYDWVRENIDYKFDTQIHTCMEALEAGVGDCEELSSLVIAICRINKIPARAVWVPGHTYPEFYLEDAEGNGAWYPCEAAGSRSFGAMNSPRPILQKGDKFKVPGSSDPLRYVQPTLVAKQVNGQPTLEWISEQVLEPADESIDSNDSIESGQESLESGQSTR